MVRRMALAAAMMAMAASAGAGTVTRGKDGLVSVRAERVPLQTLLDDLATVAEFEAVLVDPSAAAAPVTVVLASVPAASVVTEALRAAGVTFAVGGLRGQALRVVVRDVPALPAGPRSADAPEVGRRLRDVAAGPRNDDPGEGRRHVRNIVGRAARAERSAEPPQVDTPGASDTLVTDTYTMVGESVTHHDPNFIPYKNSEAARRARAKVDPGTVP